MPSLKALTLKVTIMKALSIMEFVTMAKAEINLRLKMESLHLKALAALVKTIPDRGTLDIAVLAKRLAKSYMSTFEITDRVRKQVELAYGLAGKAMARRINMSDRKPGEFVYEIKVGVKKAEGDQTFVFSLDLPDERSVQALADNYVFWYGSHYEARLIEVIKRVVIGLKLRDGLKYEDVAVDLRDAITKELGLGSGPYSTSYFETLAASVTTTARSAGMMSALEKAGAVNFTINNPEDERTCPRCLRMAGKTFPLEAGLKQMEALKAAKTPDDVKRVQPWLPEDEFLKIGEDPKKLAAAGVVLPPYHGQCRCSIDIGTGGSTL